MRALVCLIVAALFASASVVMASGSIPMTAQPGEATGFVCSWRHKRCAYQEERLDLERAVIPEPTNDMRSSRLLQFVEDGQPKVRDG